MPDYAGPLQQVVLSRTLWLVVAGPILAFAWLAFVARTRLAGARGADAILRELASARLAGVAGVALATAATLAHAVMLARQPSSQRALFEHVARGARIGQVDAGLDLWLDVRALTACGLACAVVLAAALFVATRPPPDRGWAMWAWLQLALAGALVSFLADGFATLAIGWAVAGAAGAWLAGWYDDAAGVVAAMRTAVALGMMLVGAALLFRGLGGAWEDNEYAIDADLAAGVAPVHVGSGTGEASLTMTSLPGALVFVDDARAPFMRAPFVRVPVPAGAHVFRVRAGDGSDDVVVGRVQVDAGESLALVPLGPTLSFHSIADQLAVRDRQGLPVVRRAVEAHVGPGGVAVVAGVLLALLGAAGAMSAWSIPAVAPRALAGVASGVTTAALGPYLLARVDFLFPSAQHTGAVVASVGAAVLLAAVWRALGQLGMPRWLAFAGGAPTGLTCVALGLGGMSSAMQVMVATGLASSALHLVAARRGEDEDAPLRRESLDDAVLVRVPERLGALLASMERWVVESVASAMAATALIAAWVVANVDQHVVASPADVVASRVERAAEAIEPLVGAPLGRAIWALLAVVALAALVYAAWPGG
ncbi:MAG TPA: hypothetical protein VIF15_18790 [Polyangiaceae bacterium]|jgi:hypothetical protein